MMAATLCDVMRADDVKQILASHRQRLAELGAAQLWVFGSVARGEARVDSDVDILVELSRPVGLVAFSRLRRFLEQTLGTKVDLGTPDSLRPSIRAEVLTEAVRVA